MPLILREKLIMAKIKRSKLKAFADVILKDTKSRPSGGFCLVISLISCEILRSLKFFVYLTKVGPFTEGFSGQPL